MPEPPAVLEARDVRRTYGSREVLRGVSMALRAGELTALMGPSGSGKSTLVRVLHMLEAPDGGYVCFRGEPARAEAMRRIALVQQRPGLLRARAWENAAFYLRARGAARPHAEREARACLARLGMAARADTHAHLLSGGEMQRVALARALATRSDALLLDEATNQLDPETARVVEALLAEERARGCAILMVTHSVAQARRLADSVAFLEEGRIVEAGPTGEALARPRLRAYAEWA